MKSLILLIALISISTVIAGHLKNTKASYRTSHHTSHKTSHKTSYRTSEWSQLALAGEIFSIAQTIQELDGLANSDELARAWWTIGFRKYDIDGEEGLSKDEFSLAFNDWSESHGFGAHMREASDAIWEALNTNHDDVISIDEAVLGSKNLFGWYKDAVQNRLRAATGALNKLLQSTKCQDVKKAYERLRYPSVPEQVQANWDTDGSGRLSRQELDYQINKYIAIPSIQPLSTAEADSLWSRYTPDGNGEVSLEEGWQIFLGYVEKIEDRACRS